MRHYANKVPIRQFHYSHCSARGLLAPLNGIIKSEAASRFLVFNMAYFMGSGPLKYDWQRVSGDLAWLRVQVSRNTSLFMAANIKCKEKKIIDRIFKTALNRRDSHPALCTIYAHFHFVLCDAMRTRKIWEKENHIHTHTYTPHTYIHSNRDKGRVWAFPYNMKMPLNTYYGSLHPARVILQLEWAIRHSPFPFPFSYPFPPPLREWIVVSECE